MSFAGADVTHQNADGERGVRNPERRWKDPLALVAQHVANDLHSLRPPSPRSLPSPCLARTPELRLSAGLHGIGLG